MSATILYGETASAAPGARVDGEHLWLAPAELSRTTGWKLESQGLCKGDACVRTDASWLDADGRVDLTAFAAHLGQPVVRDDASRTFAFGAALKTRHDQMFSLEAPDFALPDLSGRLHRLSDYRGKKVFLHSWGSY